MRLIQIVLAILVPPLSVFLTSGFSSALIINILLTFIGYVPGIIHALWIISKQSEEANA